MKAKPKGARYRNLFARVGVIYYERVVGDRRIKLSTKTSDWDVAASFRDLFEQRKGVGKVSFFAETMPRFADFAARYLAEDTAHLAETTRRDREHSYLGPEGRLLRVFGLLPLDEITAPRIREWWNAEIQAAGLSTKTGRSYLDALSGVLAYAQDLGIIEMNPVRDFRDSLRRRAHSKRGRAESEAGREVRPIEQSTQIAALLTSAQEEGLVPWVLALTLLDAGVRLGEALGLRWGRIAWGRDEDASAELSSSTAIVRGAAWRCPVVSASRWRSYITLASSLAPTLWSSQTSSRTTFATGRGDGSSIGRPSGTGR